MNESRAVVKDTPPPSTRWAKHPKAPVYEGELAGRGERCEYCNHLAVLKFLGAIRWVPGCRLHWDQARVDAEISPQQLEMDI